MGRKKKILAGICVLFLLVLNVPGTKIIPFSAQTKQGREEIWDLIDELTGMAEPEEAPEE